MRDFSKAFLDPVSPILESTHHLPHWHQPGILQFITFRLADSIPLQVLRQWQHEEVLWRRLHPKPWTDFVAEDFRKSFVKREQDFLDQGAGSCILAIPRFRVVVEAVLNYFEGVRYETLSSVIMPNHVHVLCRMLEDWKVGQIVASWKKASAREINGMKRLTGEFWQQDYFDRAVRDDGHLLNCIWYIRNNPPKAKLQEDNYTLFEGEFAQSVEPPE